MKHKLILATVLAVGLSSPAAASHFGGWGNFGSGPQISIQQGPFLSFLKDKKFVFTQKKKDRIISFFEKKKDGKRHWKKRYSKCKSDCQPPTTTPVPVPASLPLAAAGLGLLGWIGRRRKKA